MANFVEQATLIVVDKSSGQIKKINAALKDLAKTAKSAQAALNKAPTGSGFSKAIRDAKSLTAALKQAGAVKITPTVNLTGARAKLASLKAKPTSVVVTANVARARAAINNLKAKPTTVNVRANTTQARAAINALRTRNLVINVKANTTQARQAINGIQPRGVSVPVTANTSSVAASLKGVANHFGQEISQQLTRAIIQGITDGFKEGYNQADIARSKTNLQQLTPEQQAGQRTAIDAFLTESAARPGGATLTRTESEKIASEISPALRGDPKAMAFVLKELQAMIELQVQLGQDRTAAIESAFEFVKASEASGNIKNAKTGAFDPKLFSDFMTSLRQVAPDIGQEFTGRFVRQAIKYLRGNKTGIAGEQLISTLLLNEESGSTASVGLNQAIKMFAGGQTSKKTLAFLSKLGLITTEDIKTGKVGRKTTKETVISDIVNEEALRSRTLTWVRTNIIPKMLEQGLDPTNKVDVGRFVTQMGGTNTTQDVVSQMILRSMDLMQAVQQAQGRSSTPEDIARIGQTSGMLAFTTTGASVDDLLGQLSISFNTPLIPALKGVSAVMATMTEFVQGPNGPDPVRGAALATGVIGTGIAGLAGAFKLTQSLFGTAANTAAVTANTGALAANTAALLGSRALPGAAGSWAGTLAGAPAAAAASKLGRFGLAAAAFTMVTGAIQAIQNSTTEGRKSSVAEAKSVAKWITSFVLPDVVNDPTLPANLPTPDRKDANSPEWVKTWNKTVEAGGKKTYDAIANFFNAAGAASSSKEPVAAVQARVTKQVQDMAPVIATSAVLALEGARNARDAGLTGTTDVSPGKLADDLGIGEQVKANIVAGSDTLKSTFDSGTASIQGAVANIGTTITGVAAGISTALTTGGQSVAQAILSALANGVTVNNNTGPATRPIDTGAANLGHQ